jgi:Rieske Fe-S protein
MTALNSHDDDLDANRGPAVPVTDAAAADTAAALSRRTVLAAGVVLAGAGVASLAGCSTGSSKAAGPAKQTVPSSSAPAVLTEVAKVPVGSAVSATYQGQPILISRPTAGTIVAFSAICTHQGCTVAPAGNRFVCPCHGSVYNAATGAVITGPAPAPLPSVAVHVSGADVIGGA